MIPLDPDHSPLAIGRLPTIDIVLRADRAVSRLHAELRVLGGEWVVVDDGLSRNGSFLNGARIRGRRRLVDGDELRFGRTRLVYHAPPRRPSAAARSVGQLAPDELRVLIELARPRRADALAAPATDTTIACALDLGLAVVRDMIARACVELRIDTADGARARARLADALLAWDVREGPTT